MQQRRSSQPLDYAAPSARRGARRWLVAVMGCIGCWVTGLFVGGIVASIYQRVRYPADPDPVHFDIGAVFLLAWLLCGGLGSAFFIWRAHRSVSA